MKPYSVDLRERLLRAIDAGLPQAEAAPLFGVGTSTITRWRHRQRETGTLAPTPRPGRTPLIGPAQQSALEAQVRAAPAALAEHCATWAQEQGTTVSPATMSRALAKLGWPLKQSPSSPANATKRPARRGGKRRRTWTRLPSSSLTRRAPTPR